MGDERLTDPAIGLLEALVAIPSPSGQEREAVEGLVSWMSAHGLRAHIDAAGNAVGQAGTGARTVVLLGHIDTFGGMLPVRREGDLLHGRGTVDAKGALCAFAAAAARAHIPDGWRVVVIGAVEEECPTSAGAHYAASGASMPTSPTAPTRPPRPPNWRSRHGGGCAPSLTASTRGARAPSGGCWPPCTPSTAAMTGYTAGRRRASASVCRPT
ncbi:MAG: M20/M25/M40 family metallo-hydrolase [Anaerolineae bacterium]|nr:M20/M25/M40 family metallo-hydrolase [Anaerolineae bacterium]